MKIENTINSFPKVSIIIPTYNSEKTIEDSIKSVIEQTYPNIELLIIDGLSKDSTPTILKKYLSSYNNIQFLSEADKGVYDAMNKGIALAQGEFLFFLGSDDTFFNNTIISEIFTLSDILKYDIIYGNVKYKGSAEIYNGKYNKYKLLYTNICHQAIFTRKSVFEKIGKFNTKYFLHADYEFNIKWMHDRTIKRKYLNKIISTYNETGLSATSKASDDFHIESKKVMEQDFFSSGLPKFIYNNRYRIGIRHVFMSNIGNYLAWLI